MNYATESENRCLPVRAARIQAPGALHHVIVRGIERGKIFRSDYDRRNFLNRLEKLIPETQTDCFAWALIPNHVHLLLRAGLRNPQACNRPKTR